jgi:hypothetical protein
LVQQMEDINIVNSTKWKILILLVWEIGLLIILIPEIEDINAINAVNLSNRIY